MTDQIVEIKSGSIRYRVDFTVKDVLDDKGVLLRLTDQNWKLLNLFIENGSQTLLDTNYLVDNVWGKDNSVTPETVGQAVRALREKLGDQFIETVYRRGYKFVGSIERLTPDNEPSALPGTRNGHNRLDQATEDYSASRWSLSDPIGTDGLAELRIHQPRPGNHVGTFYVDATLRVDVAEYEHEDRIVVIGLKNAFLSIEPVGCQPSKGTMLGERIACETIKTKPRGIEFTAQTDQLSGDLLGEEYIAVMESTAQDQQSVALELRAGRRSFNVAVKGADGCEIQNISTEKNSILEALIYKLRSKDGQGRVILANAKMWKCPQK